MANFVISFKFKADDSYDDRYYSFVEKVREIATTHPWDETSSFFALEADETAENLCERLWLETSFSHSKDRMLVIDISNKQKATKGSIELPYLLEKGLGF